MTIDDGESFDGGKRQMHAGGIVRPVSLPSVRLLGRPYSVQKHSVVACARGRALGSGFGKIFQKVRRTDAGTLLETIL